jgi:hypothetical protein
MSLNFNVVEMRTPFNFEEMAALEKVKRDPKPV